jgi:hypothetical protein
LAQIFRDPAKAPEHVERYVAALQALQIPPQLPWIANRLASVIELFSAALPSERPPGSARAGKATVAAARRPAGAAPGLPRPSCDNGMASAAARSLDPAPGVSIGGVTVLAAPPSGEKTAEEPGPPQRHGGVGYLQFLKFIAQQLAPSSYFEIGTRNGASLAQVECDAVCVDENFGLSNGIMKNRRRAHLFQMTSDEFFADCHVTDFFPGGIDLAFLDGMHLFEFLLRDFMNTEKYCHRGSTIFMHDCLPYNKNITGRARKPGAWAGDVWKILPVLKRCRPEIKVVFFDCPPTGLVACTNLDPQSSVLSNAYPRLVEEFTEATALPSDLQSIYPKIDTRWLLNHPEELSAILPGPAASKRPAEGGVP